MNVVKDHLRTEMKTHRAVLASAQPRAGDLLAETVAGDLETMRLWPKAGAVIAGYWPIQTEINPLPLLQSFAERGYKVALPALIADASAPNGHHMVFRSFEPDVALSIGPFGISQPDESAIEHIPDVVLTPLLAFDLKGHRLGYGGGYYDRALSFIRKQKGCMAIGLGFAGQKQDAVSVEPFDQPLDMIFTEAGVFRLD